MRHFDTLRKAEHAAMAGLTLTVCGTALMLMHGQALADTTDSASQVTVNNDAASVSQTNTDQQSSSQTAATQTYQNVAVQKQSYNTQVALINVQAAADQKTANTADNEANKQAGSLDQTTYSSQNLHVSGWHAADQSVNQPNHFLIIYDRTDHKQLASQNITDHEVNRPDVQQAHPDIANANTSGFSWDFKIDSPDYLNHQLALVSRYSNWAEGNGDNGSGSYTDMWFNLPLADRDNKASLDNASISKGKLHVSGWHATKNSLNQPYHYIIILNSQNRELARQKVTNTSRTDVARAYPNLYNAVDSGFSADFNLQSNFLNQPLRIISRYSADPDGNNNFTDVWFNPVEFRDNHANRGSLDQANISNGHDITVSGWHAADDSIYEPNHFLILYDQTSHQQVASVAVETTSSDDVHRAYPGILESGNSRFNYTFKNIKLQAGHFYRLVSRYSAIATGNGDDGHSAKTDFWYNAFTLDNQVKYTLESWHNDGQTLSVNGWMIDSGSVDKPYAYALLLNNGKEVQRVALQFTDRDDVARVYPKVWNSQHSGFVAKFDLKKINSFKSANDRFQLILRFSNQSNGEGNYDQAYSDQYKTNQGYYDRADFNQNNNNLTVSGWHAYLGGDGVPRPYEYIIAMVNGHEVHRWQLTGSQKNCSRGDIAQKFGYDVNAAQSGFTLNVNAPELHGKAFSLIHRITDDKDGNGNAVDLWINNLGLYSSLTYNMTANAVNRFILYNHIGHANIEYRYVIPQVTGPGTDTQYNEGKPTMVVVHETANPNDSIEGEKWEINYERAHYNNAFVHAFVDGSRIIEISPTDRPCWGAGHVANHMAVQFEQVEVYGRDNFARELANAAYYAAFNIVKYQIKPNFNTGRDSTLYSHHMVSNYLGGTNHVDPDGYWANRAGRYFGSGYTMADFDELVKYAIRNWVL